MWNALHFALVLATALQGGLCIGTSFSPPNGTEVTQLIGAQNVTFECILVDGEGVQQVVQWNIENFRGEEGLRFVITTLTDTILEGESTNGTSVFPTFRSRLTFPVFLEDFDRAALICGLSSSLREGQFQLRVYREPLLLNLSTPLRFVEGEDGLVASVEGMPAAHPTPTTFQWSRMGGGPLQTDSRRTFGYPNLMINDVRRSDSGRYSLTATNFFLDEPTRELGTGAGSITLDIIYGPFLDSGPTTRAARLNDSLTLECGTNLESNPPPVVTWTDPSGAEVVDGGRFSILTDSSSVRLVFSETRAQDNGTWSCLVTVEGINVTRPGGEVAPSLVVGNFSNSIELAVVVAPGVPLNLSVDDFDATWANLCWQRPSNMGQPGIAKYVVVSTPVSGGPEETFISTLTRLNVTGLLPNVQYMFRVQAVAVALEVKNPSMLSEAVSITTETTVPSLSCNSIQPIGGGIRVEWSFIHTGGLPLDAITIRYSFVEQGGAAMVTEDGPEVSVDDTSADIISLVTGLTYTPEVEARNANGATLAVCSPFELTTGIPQDPEDPEFEEMGGGDVSITVRTPASGLEPGGDFFFLLFQTRISLARQADPGATTLVERMQIDNYMSGQDVSFSVEDLTVGGTYMFIVQAENRFGRSGNSSSTITLTGEGGADSSTVNAGAVAGGVIGGLLAVSLIAIIVVVLVFIFVKGSRSQGSYKPDSFKKASSPSAKYAPAPTGVKVEELPEGSPDIGTEITIELEKPKELHYADLESFRPPTSAVTSPEPITQVEQVQYAVIDTFKKAPSLEENPTNTSSAVDDKTGTSATVV